jgi:asparagine synthase (glutamine-hydrolysing)
VCGICGTISLAGAADPAAVTAMLDAMVHRGPDSSGTFEHPGVVAGIRRLRVIDLETGDQPIANEDGAVEVVLNGEIYNFRQLRDRLVERGHRFKTRTDTEVLVHLWEDDGPAMLERLNGMFALCIHDRRRDEVFLARDRVGIKPLYYFTDGKRLVFASELAALVRHGSIPVEIDHPGLVGLFLLQYVPGDATLYRGVRKLPPGHCLHVRRGDVSVRRWYEIPRGTGEFTGGLERVRAELPALLESAVRDRTVSDVPLGMFLSGGIDSSIVVHLLSACTDEPVRTFSVGFHDDRDEGELAYARLVSRRHGTRHHELRVSAEDVARRLPAMIDHLAAPVSDPATLPTCFLSELARREVTVVLTGEGADELFGGYRRYLFQSRYRGLARVPGLRTAAGLPAVERFLPSRAGQALAALAETDPTRNHLRWASTVDVPTMTRLFEPDAVERFEAEVEAHFGRYFDSATIDLVGPLRADLMEWLPHNLLAKVDRASMASSLEARVPYLDHRVVEWANNLPDDLRIRGGVTKLALREAFRDAIAPEILARPKRGFDLPLDRWFRGPLRRLATDVIRGAGTGRWEGLRPGAAEAMLDEHLSGHRDHGLPLFGLISTLLFLGGAS